MLDVELLKIKNTNFCISGIKFYGKGKLIFLPKFFINDSLVFNRVVEIIDSIDISQIRSLKNFTLPSWLIDYPILDYLDQIESKNDLTKELNKLKEKQDLVVNRIQELNRFKYILSGTGDLLEKSIKDVFKYLGFEIVSSKYDNRVDMIIKYLDKYIVIEVKGIKGSAKESFAAQLEKWSSEFYRDNKVIPKGVLIVNSYNLNNLNERKELNHFPDNMMNFIKMKNQCCLTTVTLINILEKYEQSILSTSDIFEYLYNTKGELKI